MFNKKKEREIPDFLHGLKVIEFGLEEYVYTLKRDSINKKFLYFYDEDGFIIKRREDKYITDRIQSGDIKIVQ